MHIPHSLFFLPRLSARQTGTLGLEDGDSPDILVQDHPLKKKKEKVRARKTTVTSL